MMQKRQKVLENNERVISSALTNRFLFSHLYLERLCQKIEDKREAANLIADLRGWLPDWDDSSLSSLIGTRIEPTLVGLGFTYQKSSDAPHLLRLYATYRRENLIGLCYVAHLQGDHDSLNSTIKGRHYAANIIHLCQGFIERDGRETYIPEQRDEVFFNAIILLYRMLFILYAEARELLPLGDYIHLVGAIAVSSSLTTSTRTRPPGLAWSSSDSNSVTWPAASSLSHPGTRMQISEAESSVQSVKVC